MTDPCKLAVLIAAILIGGADAAHADKRLAETTFGVEWEFVNNWDVEVTSDAAVADALPGKAILCTVASTKGLNNEDIPLLTLSHDGHRNYNESANQAMLEIITGPLTAGDPKWITIAGHLNVFAKVMSSYPDRNKACKRSNDGSCFIPAKAVLDTLNGAQAHSWKLCNDAVDPGAVGFRSYWPYTMEYARKGTKDVAVATVSTQVNFVMDIASVSCPDFATLFARPDDRTFHATLTKRVHKVASDRLSADERALLVWYLYALHHAEPIDPNDEAQHSQVKNRWPVFPKAPLHELAALLPSTEKIVALLNDPETRNELCTTSKCRDADPSLKLLVSDSFNFAAATNFIRPRIDGAHIELVVEAREPMGPLVRLFQLPWSNTGRPFDLSIDEHAVHDLMVDAGVLASAKTCAVM